MSPEPPKSLSGADNPRGKRTENPMIFVAASRGGQARANVVSDDRRATLEPILEGWIGSRDMTLMTDGSTGDLGIGATMEAHHRVIHSQLDQANPETVAHENKAEAVISQVLRAKDKVKEVGLNHRHMGLSFVWPSGMTAGLMAGHRDA